MKVKSVLFDQASGKIGNIVAAKNRNGQYFRNKVTPHNPKTPAQLAIRANFTAHAKAWRTLTDSQRLAWAGLGMLITRTDPLGNKYHPTGEQTFVGLNSTRSLIDGALLTDAPAAPEPTPTFFLVNYVLQAGFPARPAAGGNPAVPAEPEDVSLTLGFDGPPQIAQIFATAPYSAGRSFVGPSQFRQLEVNQFTNRVALDLLDAYQTVHGTMTQGSKVSFKVIPVSPSGFGGAPLRLDLTVTT